MPEERRLVTILFADIVGSTATVASEDPELVRATLKRAFSEMRAVLTAHGGTVEKFIGDAVMCVFGIPQAHDDDADRAVRAAFALRDRIDTLMNEFAFPLRLRIGANTGRVVSGADTADTLVTGAPVNEAARLQQSAAPGEIVVGASTRGLTKGAVRYAEPRLIEAKGLGPMNAYLAEALLSLVPERRGLGRLSALLVGRDAELRLLREAWRRAGERRTPALVTIYGSPGVGKSRLAGNFVEAIGTASALRGRCLSYGSGITYWPLQEMLRADASVAGHDSASVAVAKIRGAVLAAFGQTDEDASEVAQRLMIVAGLMDAGVAAPSVSGARAKDLRWAVRRYFERRAAARPLALVFDDIHWAEPELLDLIEHLSERSRAPLFVLCLARPDLRELRPAWGGGLTNVSAMQLEPLDAAETEQLIAALLATDDLAEDLRAEVVRRAAGNPLYVEELLRMLLDSGGVERRDGRLAATGDYPALAVPPTLEGLLAARLDQLDADSRRAVRSASVMGQVFYPHALPAIGVRIDALDAALNRAARRDLILELDERGPDGQAVFQFKHILIRDAAYESLPKSERWRLHDAFGRWLESVWTRTGEEPARIVAHHAERAFVIANEIREPRSVELGGRALELLIAAARRARDEGASPKACLDLSRRALAIAEMVGAPQPLRTWARGSAALARHAMEGASVRPDVLRALAEAREVPPSDVLVRLLIVVRNWSSDSSKEHALPGASLEEEAVAAARATGDPDLVVEALRARAAPLYWAGRLTEGRDLLQGVLEQARLLGAKRAVQEILVFLTMTTEWIGDWVGAAEAYRQLEHAPPQTAYERKVRPLDTVQRRAWVAGDLILSVEAGRKAIDASIELDDEEPWMRYRRAWALNDLGRDAEALVEIESGLEQIERRGVAGYVGEFRQVHARVLLALGRVGDARAAAERAYVEIADDDPLSRSTSSVALGRVREAEGDLREAERLFHQAFQVTGEFRTAEMWARVDYARFLMRHGRSPEARVQLVKARDFHPPRYANGWRGQIEALLRECDKVAAGVRGSG